MNARRFWVVGLLIVSAWGVITGGASAAGQPGCGNWQAWQDYKEDFLQDDGRVIDYFAEARSTSEGQAYSLFFALVAGDRPAFDRILKWTQLNLSGGDLSSRLMAWKWGQRPDRSWGVIDGNPAGDADVWLAYTLHQAGNLWNDAALLDVAGRVRTRIESELVVSVPGAGLVLLPGAEGFSLPGGGWQLNPSYLPLPVLRGLAKEAPRGPWRGLMKSTLVMFDAVTPQRMAPDWVVVHPGTGFRLDPTIGTAGSYDAIRNYLWAGMMPAWDPDKARLMSRLRGMRTTLESRPVPPESIDALTGRGEGAGSLGYSAALLPFLASVGAGKALAQQQARLADFRRSPKVYYERALMLFGLGWMDGRYRFERDGHLVVGWGARCTRQ